MLERVFNDSLVWRELSREPQQATSADCSGNDSVGLVDLDVYNSLTHLCRSLASPDAETANELVLITHNMAEDLKRLEELKIS